MIKKKITKQIKFKIIVIRLEKIQKKFLKITKIKKSKILIIKIKYKDI